MNIFPLALQSFFGHPVCINSEWFISLYSFLTLLLVPAPSVELPGVADRDTPSSQIYSFIHSWILDIHFYIYSSQIFIYTFIHPRYSYITFIHPRYFHLHIIDVFIYTLIHARYFIYTSQIYSFIHVFILNIFIYTSQMNSFIHPRCIYIFIHLIILDIYLFFVNIHLLIL